MKTYCKPLSHLLDYQLITTQLETTLWTLSEKEEIVQKAWGKYMSRWCQKEIKNDILVSCNAQADPCDRDQCTSMVSEDDQVLGN